MSRTSERLLLTVRQAARGDLAGAITDMKRWIHSDTVACGLKFDFDAALQVPPQPDVSVTITALSDDAVDEVFNTKGLDDANRALLERRRAIWDVGFRHAYIAITDEGQPAYLQWLIPPSQQDKVRDHWGSLFDLDADTALAEGIWIPPRFRGCNILAHALIEVNNLGRKVTPEPFRYVNAFVADDNAGAQRGFRGAGFKRYTTRTERWRAGRRLLEFEPRR